MEILELKQVTEIKKQWMGSTVEWMHSTEE